MKRKASIFKRILFNVLLPEIIVFSIIAYISVQKLNDIYDNNREKDIEHIFSEIESFMAFRDQSLDVLQELSGNRAQKIINDINEDFKDEPATLFTVRLDSIALLHGIDLQNEDLYIMDLETGIIKNATFKSDVGLNMFTFGDEFKNFLFNSYEIGFDVESFALEWSSKKYKLYSYGAGPGNNILIQLAMYSDVANEFNDRIKNRIEVLTNNSSIDSIEVFLASNIFTNVFSDNDFGGYWNSVEEEYVDFDSTNLEIPILNHVKNSKQDTTFNRGNQIYTYKYHEGTDQPYILKVLYNNEENNATLYSELRKSSLIFIFGVLALFLLLLINIRRITGPLKSLRNASKLLSEGELSTRVEVMGNDEVTELSLAFNKMAEDLETANKQLNEEQGKLKEKNEEILDSIKYAKRIQSAILPPAKLIKEYLNNSFILYKPKDIVAGDFYWMENIEGKTLFAAADCTGHGVPGAMVSVICNGALNRSVREFGLTEPGQILGKARDIVIEEFEKSEEEVKDGMDIALCSLDGNKLEYAGAHNPLWIIRNGEIIETKANKQPIGKFDNPLPYDTHFFDLQKGDTFYIFSDGYVDQFGGEKGKKFKAKAFRALLLSIQELPMEKQRERINEAFENWRGNIEQIDDVCVIGVRV